MAYYRCRGDLKKENWVIIRRIQLTRHLTTLFRFRSDATRRSEAHECDYELHEFEYRVSKCPRF